MLYFANIINVSCNFYTPKWCGVVQNNNKTTIDNHLSINRTIQHEPLNNQMQQNIKQVINLQSTPTQQISSVNNKVYMNYQENN